MKINRDSPLQLFCQVLPDQSWPKTLGEFYDSLPAAGIGDYRDHLSEEHKEVLSYLADADLFEREGMLFKKISWKDFVKGIRSEVIDELKNYEFSINRDFKHIVTELEAYADIIKLSSNDVRYQRFKQKLKDCLDACDP